MSNHKQITYDYNNRPTSVQFAGQTTAYTYGPDDARQTKAVGAAETFYAGTAEIRDLGGAAESIVLQPHADFRITGAGGANEATSYLHRDHLASVRIITTASGQPEQGTTYSPYGDPDTTTLIAQSTPEEHSFIGERFDASTGLLYLNARYMDPALGRFLQPDWWEVRIPGVGTNRYSYSMNDPVNLSDRNGNLTYHERQDQFTWDEGDSVQSIAETLGFRESRLRRLNPQWDEPSEEGFLAGTEVNVPRTRRIKTGIAAIAINNDSRFSRIGHYNGYYSGAGFHIPISGTYKCNLFVGLAVEAGFGNAPLHNGEAGVYALAGTWLNASKTGMVSIGPETAAFGDVVSWPSNSATGHAGVFMSDLNIVDRNGSLYSPSQSDSSWGIINASSIDGSIYRSQQYLSRHGYGNPNYTRYYAQ